MDKLDKMEQMFLQTQKSKTIVERGKERIKKIGSIYDSTNQSKHAITMATALAKAMKAKLKVFAADDFYKKIEDSVSTIRKKETEMQDFISNFSQEEQIASESEPLMSRRVDHILKYMDEDLLEEEKLSRLIINKLIKEEFDLFIAGSPLLRTREQAGYFGYYLRKLLGDFNIKSDFLLVPNEIADKSNRMLVLVNYKQKQGSIEAVLRKGMVLKEWSKHLYLVGILEDNTIETIARSELPEDETDTSQNVSEVRERITHKYKDLLESFKLEDEEMDLDTDIVVGLTTASVKNIIEEIKPKLVLVRNVSKVDENLDPEAENLARIALAEGYPVLLTWD
ncbi:MAG: hypothetical protein INQ03_12675 [Candidatus Heimdallarchaeota archaeon]|nr:hypothetical protein [Candidatus Heimdallarchaeota archaeon]